MRALIQIGLVLALVLTGAMEAFATHYRAGDIFYEQLGPTTFRVTVITYTKTGGQSELADRDSVRIAWGDGTGEFVERTNGADIDGNGIPDGEIVGNAIRQNIYIGTHTYPGQNTYVVSFEDENRIDGINNIQGGNSVFIPFFIADTIFGSLDYNLYGGNSTPVLLNPPIDYANVLDTFYHNPNAFDPDGDSLDFSLVVPKQSASNPVPAYVFLDDLFPGPTNNFSIDRRTGEILWAVPQPGHLGENNVAILIREYRDDIATGEPRLIGTAIRDMQIIVLNEPNDPPQIARLRDTCVYAGKTFSIGVEATDPDGDIVTLSANGGPFQVTPSASFSQTPGNPAFGTFTWTPGCDQVLPQPYQVIFKAEDDYIDVQGNPAPLVDLETWRIRVVPPPPDTLTATSIGSGRVQLDWTDPYACADAEDFRFFSVWRRTGCSPGRETCEQGLAGRGYERIATDLTTTSFIDDDVPRGNEYGYRVLAHFLDQGLDTSFLFNEVLSVPSNEACIALPLDLPVLTNVSVDSTDAADGEVFVRWTLPRIDTSGADGLDTLLDPGPYRFELFRSPGFSVASPVRIATFNSPSFGGWTDTSFVDTTNTVDGPNAYEVVFYADGGADTLGTSSDASSIFLEIAPGDGLLDLTWSEEVPWMNEDYDVFRRNDVTGILDSLATVSAPFFTDTGLINDSTYCYVIRSRGRYTRDDLPDPLRNLSQEACGVPVDTVPPCAPDLSVANDCQTIPDQLWTLDNFVNRLHWANRDTCAEDAELYRVYFADSNSTSYRFITETPDTFYDHALGRENLAGCYVVTALDEKGNESTSGDTVCVDNCPFYELPNAFTPNGDGQNDLFVPFPGYRFVDRIDLTIRNRWGGVVFETDDPEILWDGTDRQGKDLTEGVYLYNGSFDVRTVDGVERRPLPPDDGSGFIHLMRGD